MKSTRQPEPMTIGDVAARFGLATHVLRHWESVGLLAPVRVRGDRRRYGPDDLYRIAAVVRAKQAGLGLDDIRDLLATQDPAARRQIMTGHRARLIRRIDELQGSLGLIDCALDCTHEDLATCPHFQAKLAETTPA